MTMEACRMKKIYYNKRLYFVAMILCIVVLFAGIFTGCDLQRGGELPSQDIVVLYTNDVHCAVDTGIGYAGLAALESQYRNAGADVILVDCGDAIQGEPIGTVSKGAYIIDIMNEMNYDVSAVGNHEFDYGSEQFLALAKQTQFPYVACNFRYIDTGDTVFDAYHIIEAGGVQIAFVGIATPETITSSAPAYFQDQAGNTLYFFDQNRDGTALYQSVQDAVDDARKAGADYVVALSHLGIQAENPAFNSTAVIANTTGIDVVLDGHSHSVVACDRVQNAEGEWVLLSQTGTKFDSVGMLLIQEDGSISTGLITEFEEKDAQIHAFIQRIQVEFGSELQRVAAKSKVDLTILDILTGERRVRNGETNMANLCVDAYRLMTGADVAITNGGGVRDNILEGDITYEDILKVHPFGNAICVVEVTGQNILDALEFGARLYPAENGDFLHVSGMTYEIHSGIPSGVRITEDGQFDGIMGAYRVQNVMVGDEPLDVNKTYTLASHDYFLKKGGGGFTMLQNVTMLQDSIMLDNQVLINYITEYLHGEVGKSYANPYGEGRIIIK